MCCFSLISIVSLLISYLIYHLQSDSRPFSNLFLDMLSDEIDSVRIAALGALRLVMLHVASPIREDYLHNIIFVLEDASGHVREAAHALLWYAFLPANFCAFLCLFPPIFYFFVPFPFFSRQFVLFSRPFPIISFTFPFIPFLFLSISRHFLANQPIRSAQFANVHCLRMATSALLSNQSKYPQDRPRVLDCFCAIGRNHAGMAELLLDAALEIDRRFLTADPPLDDPKGTLIHDSR